MQHRSGQHRSGRARLRLGGRGDDSGFGPKCGFTGTDRAPSQETMAASGAGFPGADAAARIRSGASARRPPHARPCRRRRVRHSRSVSASRLRGWRLPCRRTARTLSPAHRRNGRVSRSRRTAHHEGVRVSVQAHSADAERRTEFHVRRSGLHPVGGEAEARFPAPVALRDGRYLAAERAPDRVALPVQFADEGLRVRQERQAAAQRQTRARAHSQVTLPGVERAGEAAVALERVPERRFGVPVGRGDLQPGEQGFIPPAAAEAETLARDVGDALRAPGPLQVGGRGGAEEETAADPGLQADFSARDGARRRQRPGVVARPIARFAGRDLREGRLRPLVQSGYRAEGAEVEQAEQHGRQAPGDDRGCADATG